MKFEVTITVEHAVDASRDDLFRPDTKQGMNKEQAPDILTRVGDTLTLKRTFPHRWNAVTWAMMIMGLYYHGDLENPNCDGDYAQALEQEELDFAKHGHVLYHLAKVEIKNLP